MLEHTASGSIMNHTLIYSINVSQVQLLNFEDELCFVTEPAGAKSVMEIFHKLCPALNRDVLLSQGHTV